jgi:predicted N-acetyltransferase YhbS
LSHRMQFKTYDEVDPKAVATLTLSGFGWNLDADNVRKLRRQDKNCSAWFAMYATEGGNVIGQVGAAYPTVETIEGTMKLGYIWGVTTQPDKTKRGVARKLMERVHEQMIDDDVDLFALSTLRSLVAHGLYSSLGYHQVQRYGWNQRRIRRLKERRIRIKARKRSNDQIYKLYREFSEGAYGFVHRHPKFVEPRCLWFPYVSDVCTFYRDDKAVGYVLTSVGKRGIVIREMFCPALEDVSSCVGALERKFPRKYITCLLHSREDVIRALDSADLAPTRPSFGVLMMRGPKRNLSRKSITKLIGKDTGRFQFTSTDEY